MPIGLRNSSAIVMMKCRDEPVDGNLGFGRGDEAAEPFGLGRPSDPMTRTAKETAVISIPKPILRGAEGSLFRLFSQLKNPTTTGVMKTMKNGLKCWKRWGWNSLTAE